MDSDKLIIESELKKGSFFEHVFNFEDDSKSEMLNIIQYTVLAIIPIVVLNKTIAKIIPNVDNNKPSFEISLEILGQSVSLFFRNIISSQVCYIFPNIQQKTIRIITYYKCDSCIAGRFCQFSDTNRRKNKYINRQIV